VHYKATHSISEQSEAFRTGFVKRPVSCSTFASAMGHRSSAGKRAVFQSEVNLVINQQKF
jgi:hypothetical protein